MLAVLAPQDLEHPPVFGRRLRAWPEVAWPYLITWMFLEPIVRNEGSRPGTEELAETLGTVMMITCMKIQSKRINEARR